MLADIFSTLLLVFFISTMPMYDRVNNGIQIINEMFVLVSVWLMFHYTDFQWKICFATRQGQSRHYPDFRP